MWQKLKDQLPAVLVTVILIGLVLGGGAYYVTNTLLPERDRRNEEQLTDLKARHAKELKDSTEQTRKQKIGRAHV